MPKFRLKSPTFDVAYWDGERVGLVDQVFGKVVPNTGPKWFPAALEEHDSLSMLEVIDGKFITVGGELFHGAAGTWRKVEPGSRLLCEDGMTGPVTTVPAATFLEQFEPA
jgi:hypothetical protein